MRTRTLNRYETDIIEALEMIITASFHMFLLYFVLVFQKLKYTPVTLACNEWMSPKH